MITLMILTTMSLWWEMVKLGGKAALWVLKWCVIIFVFMGLVIPAFFSIYFAMCLISFIIWTADIIRANIMKTEPRLDRPPFDFRKNWDRLLRSINKRAEKQEKKQAARDNSIYVVKSKDLKKATPVKPAQQPVSMDEIILYDLILDD